MGKKNKTETPKHDSKKAEADKETKQENNYKSTDTINRNKNINKEIEMVRDKKKEISKENKKESLKITVKDNEVTNKKNNKSKLEVQEEDSESFASEIQECEIKNIQETYSNNIVYLEKIFKLNDNQIKSAINCLKELLEKQYKNNLNIFLRKEDEMLHINFTFGNLPEKYSMRPVSFPVKIATSARRRICLIVKDPAKDWESMNINFDESKEIDLSVITFSSLKLDYEKYEQKRNLLKQFDMFLCDHSLYMLLKKVLGKAFYEGKKYPLAISIDKESPEVTKNIILNAATNVVFNMSNGPNYHVKSGFLVEKTDVLVDKVKKCSIHTVASIMKWGVSFEHLKSVTLKFTNSLELPIFNQLTAEEVQAYHSVLVSKKEKFQEKSQEKVKAQPQSNGQGKIKAKQLDNSNAKFQETEISEKKVNKFQIQEEKPFVKSKEYKEENKKNQKIEKVVINQKKINK